MKHLASVVVILNIGAAGIYGQQNPIRMIFSGTGGASAINLKQPGTSNGEDNTAGNGTLGPFTFRNVRAIRNAPEPDRSGACSGPTKIFFSSAAGAGVFRFQDGSLLKVKLTQAGDCIDFVASSRPTVRSIFKLPAERAVSRIRPATLR